MKILSSLLFTLAILVAYHLIIGGVLLSAMLSLPFTAPLTPLQQLRMVILWPEMIAMDFYTNRYHAAEIEQLKAKPPQQ